MNEREMALLDARLRALEFAVTRLMKLENVQIDDVHFSGRPEDVETFKDLEVWWQYLTEVLIHENPHAAEPTAPQSLAVIERFGRLP